MKRLFQLLLIVLIGLVATGYFRGWFAFSTTSAGGKTGLTITTDFDKLKADMSAAGAKISAVSKAAVEKLNGKTKAVSATQSTLTGKVASFDAATHTLQVDADGQTIPLAVPPALAGLEQLVGKQVKITLEKVGEHTVVREVAEQQ